MFSKLSAAFFSQPKSFIKHIFPKRHAATFTYVPTEAPSDAGSLNMMTF